MNENKQTVEEMDKVDILFVELEEDNGWTSKDLTITHKNLDKFKQDIKRLLSDQRAELMKRVRECVPITKDFSTYYTEFIDGENYIIDEVNKNLDKLEKGLDK